MVERELKLHVPDDFELPPLDGLAGLHADPASRRLQESTYWDTPDCRLLSHGVGLRWRSDSGWTFKSAPGGAPGPLLSRDERTLAGPPEAPPPALLRPLAEVLCGLPLAPTVGIQTDRTAIELRSGQGRPLVELVDDRVLVLNGPLQGTTWRELELELRGDQADAAAPEPDASDATMLAALLGRLREAGAGPVVMVAKHLRALGVDRQLPPRSLQAYQLAAQIAEGLAASSTRAAGGVVSRAAPDGSGRELLAVHRPRHHDWCLPKGKQEPGESLLTTAVREVEEETGLQCEPVAPLGCTAHRLPDGGSKTVWWWSMRVVAGAIAASEETDEVSWLGTDAALRTLSHEGERDLLGRLPAAW